MRIVDVNEFYSPTGGGVRTYVDRKMEILADAGHEVIVVAPGREDREEERPGGGRVLFRRSPPMPLDRNYGIFWNAEPIHALLDQFDPDVVECSSPWRPAWIVGGWRGRGLKAYFFHGDNMESYAKRWFAPVASGEAIERAFNWYDRYQTRFLAPFDVVVGNGPALTDQLTRRSVRVDYTVPLGIDRAPFSPGLRDPRLRAALLAQCGLPPDALLLLGIGRHHPEKEWGMVVDAVHRAGATLPVGLILLGQGLGTRALQKQVGESPHVRLFAPVYDRRRLATIIASADAYIHGSPTETFGLVVAEALACGTPLIVPDAGGAAYFADPRYAESYRARDAVSCADAIGRLAARGPAVLREAATAAAGDVRTDRDHALELVELYAAVIARKAQAARSA